MPFIAHQDAPIFDMHNARFLGLASPARGAQETAAWIVTLAPESTGAMHQLTREEVFVTLEGKATATVGDVTYELTPESALIVPAHTPLCISNPHSTPFRAVAILPVGAQASVAGGPSFTPPWAC